MLMDAGYTCICVDIRPRLLEQMQMESPTAPGIYIQCDVSSPADVGALAAQTADVPAFDALVLAAGMTTEGYVEQTSLEDWRRIVDVNLQGAFLVLKTFLPRMRAPGGSIVGIGSISADVIAAGGGAAAYEASKAAFTQLIRAVAFENAARGIRANIVAPGRIQTNLGNHRREDEQTTYTSRPDKFRIRDLKPIPMGRAGRPDEVAKLVRFLLSDDSAYITGANIPIDGGYGLL